MKHSNIYLMIFTYIIGIGLGFFLRDFYMTEKFEKMSTEIIEQQKKTRMIQNETKIIQAEIEKYIDEWENI